MYAMLTLIIAHHSQKSTVICEEYRALTENFLFLGFTKGEKTAIMFRLSSRCTGGSMDRASDSGSEGWGFESLPVYQIKSGDTFWYPHFLFRATRGKGLEHFNPTARWAVGRWVGAHRYFLGTKFVRQNGIRLAGCHSLPVLCIAHILRDYNVIETRDAV